MLHQTSEVLNFNPKWKCHYRCWSSDEHQTQICPLIFQVIWFPKNATLSSEHWLFNRIVEFFLLCCYSFHEKIFTISLPWVQKTHQIWNCNARVCPFTHLIQIKTLLDPNCAEFNVILSWFFFLTLFHSLHLRADRKHKSKERWDKIWNEGYTGLLATQESL